MIPGPGVLNWWQQDLMVLWLIVLVALATYWGFTGIVALFTAWRRLKARARADDPEEPDL